MDGDQAAKAGSEPLLGEKCSTQESSRGDNKNVIEGPASMEVSESNDPSASAGIAPGSRAGTTALDGSLLDDKPTSGGLLPADDVTAGSSVHQPSEITDSLSPQGESVVIGNPEPTVSEVETAPQNSDAMPANVGPSLAVVSPSGAEIDLETAGMYANVASALVTKVNKLNDISRQCPSEASKNNLNSTSNGANESLSLIMSYDVSDEDSGEETEKEEAQNNFSAPRYVPISSGCSSGDEESSEDENENTDGGSSGEESEEAESGDEESNARSIINAEKVDSSATANVVKNRKEKDLRDPLMLDLLPPIEKLTISVPEEECVPIGKIYSIVDRLVVIESLPDTPPLMLDSVIFNREGSALGQIFDIFGHVKRPFYSIRFNTPEEIKELNVSVGRVVYCAPKTDHTKYVFTHDLMKEKGSDASWKNDEEPPPSALDYSDDEAERKAKKGSKVKKEPEADSPARRRHLSFEQQMNRNNTLRNRAFKRDAQGEARNNWDGGWHNYKKNNPQQFQAATCDPPPPPPPRQIQPCVYSNPTVNPMNLVIRPPCFNPVIERPPVPLGPSPNTWAPWARFEPPPTPPPRGFQYPSSPPSGGFQPNFALGPFQRFQSPPSSGFPGFGASTYGPPPMAFSPPAPAFSSPPPPSLPMHQPPVPSRFAGPQSCRASMPCAPIPPAPFSGSHFSSYHPPKPANSNHPNHPGNHSNHPGNHPNHPGNHPSNHPNHPNHPNVHSSHPGNHPNQPRIPRLPFTSNNNHPPLYNHPPF